MGFANAFPHEVMGAPHSLWIATASHARPALTVILDADLISAGWTKIGKNGNKSYAEEGVRVNSPAAYNKFRGYGSAAPLKMFRSEEDVMVQVSLADMTLESMAYGFNKLASGVSDVGNVRTLGLSRGLGVLTVAVLVRGPSPYMDDGVAQFWVPAAANTSAVEFALRRENGTIYGLQFEAILDPTQADGFEMGVYEAQDAVS